MKYTVLISRSAEKKLRTLSPDIQRKISAIILSFELEPKPFGSKKLSGTSDTYRVRAGDYRIIYEIKEQIVTVTVLKIGHRKDVYR